MLGNTQNFYLHNIWLDAWNHEMHVIPSQQGAPLGYSMKETLNTGHRNTVEPMMIAKDRKATLHEFHADAVTKAVESHERNVVIYGRHPPIRHNQEATLDPCSSKINIFWTPGLLQKQNQEG